MEKSEKKYKAIDRLTAILNEIFAEKDAEIERLRDEIAKKDDAFTRTTDNLTNQLAELRLENKQLREAIEDGQQGCCDQWKQWKLEEIEQLRKLLALAIEEIEISMGNNNPTQEATPTMKPSSGMTVQAREEEK